MKNWKIRCVVMFMWAAVLLSGGCGREEYVQVIGATAEPLREEDPAGGIGEENMIRVYVCGCVKNPGVVSVPQGSRVEDALEAAGGFGEDAGREAVNLADWVEDGQMVCFPTREEAALQEEQRLRAQEGLVDINKADAALLSTLPGIGESRAADIVAYREKNGPFLCCEDIMKVPGIKTSVYEKICDKIIVQ